MPPRADRDRRGPRARARHPCPRPAPADPAAAAGARDLGLVGRDVRAEAARRRPRVPRRRVQRHDGLRAHEADAGRAVGAVGARAVRLRLRAPGLGRHARDRALAAEVQARRTADPAHHAAGRGHVRLARGAPTCPPAASGTTAARGRRITCPSRASPRRTAARCGTSSRRHPARLLECSSRCPSTSSKKPKNRSRRCARRPSARSARRSVRTCAASRSPTPPAKQHRPITAPLAAGAGDDQHAHRRARGRARAGRLDPRDRAPAPAARARDGRGRAAVRAARRAAPAGRDAADRRGLRRAARSGASRSWTASRAARRSRCSSPRTSTRASPSR